MRDAGDAEHFRPKGSVAQLVGSNGSTKKVKVRIQLPDGSTIYHPGYFWLAYNWRNLLPACKYCNSAEGKLDKFPVKGEHKFLVLMDANGLRNLKDPPYPSKKWTGYYYLGPRDLDLLEKRLLLHPYFDVPQRHLRFGYAGIVAEVTGSEMGGPSIHTCDLDDDNLLQARHREQNSAYLRFTTASGMRSGTPDENYHAALAAIDEFIKGTAPYSAAVCDWIEDNDRRAILRDSAGA